MLVERYVPLKNIAVSRSSCVQGHYLLTVIMYFFVSTILKVPTEFSFGIGMVITEKYVPTNTDQKIPTWYTTLDMIPPARPVVTRRIIGHARHFYSSTCNMLDIFVKQIMLHEINLNISG
jgi:hypothetical protein